MQYSGRTFSSNNRLSIFVDRCRCRYRRILTRFTSRLEAVDGDGGGEGDRPPRRSSLSRARCTALLSTSRITRIITSGNHLRSMCRNFLQLGLALSHVLGCAIGPFRIPGTLQFHSYLSSGLADTTPGGLVSQHMLLKGIWPNQIWATLAKQLLSDTSKTGTLEHQMFCILSYTDTPLAVRGRRETLDT